MIPDVKRLSKRIARVMKKRPISTAIRPHTTLRNLPVHPKDNVEPREGVYKVKCQGCEGCYVGETKRKLAVRVKEHRADVENPIKECSHGGKTNNQKLRETVCHHGSCVPN